jgi:Flp pilus assembly protein TadD
LWLGKAAKLDASELLQYEVIANRGSLSLRRGKLEEAIADLNAAAKVRSQECQTHLQLARAFERLKRFTDADRAVDEARRLRFDLALIPKRS